MITPEGVSIASDRVRNVIANVRLLRKARGWSAKELGERMAAAGIVLNRSTIASLENGRRDNISIDELWTFSALFGVEVDRLVMPMCTTCKGQPPKWFICGACGADGTP